MATVILRDEALWAQPVAGDPDLARAIRSLQPDRSLSLRIDGPAPRFRSVVATATGHLTGGDRLGPADAALTHDVPSRRGPMITTGAGSRWPSNHTIGDLAAAGLQHPWVVRGQLFTLPDGRIHCRIDHSGAADRTRRTARSAAVQHA